MFIKAHNSICASSGVASDPLSPTPSTSSTVKASKNTEQDPEPADQEDIQTEYYP